MSASTIKYASSRLGCSTSTSEKRRARPASAAKAFWKSSGVVAPMHGNSPRENASFSSDAISSAASPTNSWWISSKNSTTRPLAASTSLRSAPMRDASAPRTPVPATSSLTGICTITRSSSDSTSSAAAMRCARPRTMLVLPTPAMPTKHGLLPSRLARTSSACSITASRPTTGSSSPRAAARVKFRPSEVKVGNFCASSSKRSQGSGSFSTGFSSGGGGTARVKVTRCAGRAITGTITPAPFGSGAAVGTGTAEVVSALGALGTLRGGG